MGFATFDERFIVNQQAGLGFGSTPGGALLTTGAQSASRIDAISVVNNDVVDHIIWLSVLSTSDDNRLGSVNIPARTGFDGTNSIDLVATLAPPALGAFMLANGTQIFIGTDDTLAGTALLSANAVRGDF